MTEDQVDRLLELAEADPSFAWGLLVVLLLVATYAVVVTLVALRRIDKVHKATVESKGAIIQLKDASLQHGDERVKSKDATIETLRERVEVLESRLAPYSNHEQEKTAERLHSLEEKGKAVADSALEPHVNRLHEARAGLERLSRGEEPAPTLLTLVGSPAVPESAYEVAKATDSESDFPSFLQSYDVAVSGMHTYEEWRTSQSLETTWTQEYVRRLYDSQYVTMPRIAMFPDETSRDAFHDQLLACSYASIVHKVGGDKQRPSVAFNCEAQHMLTVAALARSYGGDVLFPGAL